MVGHGGKRESGAGTLDALVKNERFGSEETSEGTLARHFHECRDIHQVPEVKSVGTGREHAAVEGGRGGILLGGSGSLLGGHGGGEVVIEK
jgi:hypothetical protein